MYDHPLMTTRREPATSGVRTPGVVIDKDGGKYPRRVAHASLHARKV